MILINHPSLNNIASRYSEELYAKFEYRKKMIEKVLENLESDGELNFQPYSANECLPAFKAIINIKKLNAPPVTAQTTVILDDYINQVRLRNTVAGMDSIPLAPIKKRLASIFRYDLKSLFFCDISEIKQRNAEFKRIVNREKINKDLSDFFFDYTKYYRVINEYIGMALGIICCPYCNRNYITYISSEQDERIIGPTYDHFFNKKEYIYASLCFFNLIPSCTICNSNLKHQINFDLATHLYPYKDEFGENAYFDFDFSLAGHGKESKIVFKPVIRIKAGISSEDELKLEGRKIDPDREVSGNIKVFKLREIYESHHDTVEEVHNKFYENDQYYIASIKENLSLLGSAEGEFYRFHFNNYFDSSDFHRRPLAKLTRDIYNKLKKIQDTGLSSI